MKTCTVCLTEKPHGDFYKHSAGKDGLRPDCKACHLDRMKRWRATRGDRGDTTKRERQARWYANDPGTRLAYNKPYLDRRRAQKRKVTSDLFDRREIFERDRWLCGICGGSVDRELKHPDPLSASLDHIIPLSRGGEHSRQNTQCSHLTCNLRKNNKYDGTPRSTGSQVGEVRYQDQEV